MSLASVEYQEDLFQSGFVIVDLASLSALLAAAHPAFAILTAHNQDGHEVADAAKELVGDAFALAAFDLMRQTNTVDLLMRTLTNLSLSLDRTKAEFDDSNRGSHEC